MVATSAETPRQGFAGLEGGVAWIALSLALIVAVFVVAFFPTITWMAGEWSSSSGALSHGYLVAAISVVLFVRAIPGVALQPIKAAWWLLPVLLGLSIVWLLAYVATVVAVQTLVLPAILIIAIAVVLGIRAARPLTFPVLYVYFAVPAWEHLQFVFQAITVTAVSLLLRVSDVPAIVDGNTVHLSVGNFEIAGGCSGLSFIVAGLSLAVLYAHLYYHRTQQVIALAALVIAVSMFGNWIRVFAIIVIGYVSEMQSGLVDDHLTFGWIMFAVLMLPVYVIARRLEDEEPISTHPVISASSENASPVSIVAVAIAITIMIVGPSWAATARDSWSAGSDIELELPGGQGKWVGPSRSGWDWAPDFAGAAIERMAQYGVDDDFVLVYTNFYPHQEQDRELVYFSNRVAGDWRDAGFAENASRVIKAAGNAEYRQIAATNYAGNWLIWYRYQVGNSFTASDTQAKIRQAFETLRGRSASGAIAFAALCRPDCAAAEDMLTNFVDEVGHAIRVKYSRGEK